MNKKSPLSVVTPLMSITAYSATPTDPNNPTSDMRVSITYYQGKNFKGTVTHEDWTDFMDRYESANQSFWDMGD